MTSLSNDGEMVAEGQSEARTAQRRAYNIGIRSHAKAKQMYRSRDIAIHIRYNPHLNSMTPCLTSHLLASARLLFIYSYSP
jgi:hypothetical protein